MLTAQADTVAKVRPLYSDTPLLSTHLKCVEVDHFAEVSSQWLSDRLPDHLAL